jgi:hypothetical protein
VRDGESGTRGDGSRYLVDVVGIRLAQADEIESDRPRPWGPKVDVRPVSTPRDRGNVPAVAFVFGLYVFVVVVGLVCGIAASLL